MGRHDRRRHPALAMAGHAAAMAGGRWLLAAAGPPPPPAGRPPSGAERLSVVIPARNEAAPLPRLLLSLSAQTRRPDEIVVVDDHSDDATARLAAAAGATVVRSPELPPGWLGKPWACHQGAGVAVGHLLLFLDADVVLAPDAIERLLVAHRRWGGLITVQPGHVTFRRYEQLSAVCNVVAVMGAGGTAGGAGPPMQVAFGPCMLVGREDYDAIGGHTDVSVRAAVCEDAAIATLLHARGVRVTGYTGGDVVRYRMYPDGPRQLADGWTKMLAGGARRSPGVPTVVVVAWIAGALRGAAAGSRALRQHRPPARRAADAAIYVAWGLEMRRAMRQVGRWSPSTPWLFPAPLGAFVGLAARSAYLGLTGRPARWRGRAVPTR